MVCERTRAMSNVIAPGSALVPAPFLVGVTRSGKTLLRLMLDSHPELTIPPETHFVPRLAQRFGWGTDGRKPAAANFFASFFSYEGIPYVLYTRRPDIADPVELFLNTLKAFYIWRDFHLDEDVLRSHLRLLEPFDLSEGVRIFYKLYAERFGKTRWGDKTPEYSVWMGLVHGLLPEARFIHMIRDGRDIWVARRNLWFTPQTIEEAAKRWVLTIENARRQARRIPHYCEIRYEALVLNPGRTLRTICDFIDLPWDPSMLEYHQRAAERLEELSGDFPLLDGRRLSKAERVAPWVDTTREPDPSLIGLWKKEMRPLEIRAYEATAGDMLKTLGYEVG